MGRAAWVTPGRFPALAPDEVHVWQSRTSEHAVHVDELRSLLSPEETARAARFRAQRDADEYTIARATLRLLIGGYDGVAPWGVVLDYTEQGKPVLASRASGLEFNVSHSRGLALFAFARSRRVGVDVEALERQVDHDDIAQRFFTAAESSALRALPAARRPR
ncbi:MAG TPA: hypothetical protein VFP36_06150, partial [Usitatibacter sp.]|nr:hypothetical protein [Usitatibacter sp.]